MLIVVFGSVVAGVAWRSSMLVVAESKVCSVLVGSRYVVFDLMFDGEETDEHETYEIYRRKEQGKASKWCLLTVGRDEGNG